MAGLGRITTLHIAATSGGAMGSVDQVQLVAGVGIVGDRYHGSRHRHVSVQSMLDLAEAEAALGVGFGPAATRRNVTLSGNPPPTAPGSRIRIARVELEVVRIAAPCRVMDETIAPGARAALRRRGGVICRVLTGGFLAVGDAADEGDAQAAAGTVAANR